MISALPEISYQIGNALITRERHYVLEYKPNDKAVSYCRQKLLSGVLPTNAIKSEFTIIYPPKGKKQQ